MTMDTQRGFHRDETDLDHFYDVVADAYRNIFQRVGFPVVFYTEAGGWMLLG